ncbi:MAG: hypothetical protein WBB98_04555 [Xanthobacteraceae bacterium]
MADFPSYAYGTVTVAANGTIVTGTDTLWSGVNARSGDDITIAGHSVIVVDVTDETHLAIDAWPYDAVTDGDYKITQRSPLRFVGGQARADLTQLLATLKAKGLMWYLPDGLTEPDDAKPPLTADEGQVIQQATIGKTWVMQGGAWVFVGTYKGFGVAAPWDSGTAYNVNDVVSLDGTSYVASAPNTSQTPPNATYWTVLASKGDIGATGDAATISVGTVTTLSYGAPATVTNVGDAHSAVFDFGIPAGQDGTGAGDMLKSAYDPNNVGADVFSRSNQTGTQALNTVDYFSLDVKGEGRQGIDNLNGWMIYQTVDAVPTNTVEMLGSALRLVAELDYDGGTANRVTTGLDLRVDVGADVDDFVWGLNVHMENSGSGENSGGYIGVNKNAGVRTFGLVVDVEDKTQLDSGSLVGIEIDIMSNGADSNSSRVALDIVAGKGVQDGPEIGELGVGIRIGPRGDLADPDAIFDKGIVLRGSYNAGLNFLEATQRSGGDMIKLNAGHNIRWGSSGPRLYSDGTFIFCGGAVLSMAQSFNVPSTNVSTGASAGTGSALPAAPAGYLSFKIDGGGVYKIPYFNN